MVIHGQMARVPVTARQKFGEAVYFYNRMAANRPNVIVFPYYLSAFVSALRSVTFYMQKQYDKDSRFEAWYAQKQDEMRQDPVLRMLVDKRNIALHAEPFDLYFYQSFNLPKRYGGVIETTHLDVRQGNDDEGWIWAEIKVGEDGEFEKVEPFISWHFSEDDKVDVTDHCRHGLDKLNLLLDELSALGLDRADLAPDEKPAAE
jgi:hypothetical protein